MKINFTKHNYEKQDGKWVLVDTEKKAVTQEFYKNYVDPAQNRFFNNLGAVARSYKSYTAMGYVVTRCTNLSPCKTKKNITHFSIKA